MKKAAIAITLIVPILVLTTITVLFVVKPNPFPFDNSAQKTLLIESFSPSTFGSNVTGGKLVLLNPTNKNFENLTLTIKIDDSDLIVPNLRLQMQLPVDTPFDNYNVPITQIGIEANQNETIQLYFYDPSQNETSQLYQTNVNVQTFSSHIFRFYITQKTFGDVVNARALSFFGRLSEIE